MFSRSVIGDKANQFQAAFISEYPVCGMQRFLGRKLSFEQNRNVPSLSVFLGVWFSAASTKLKEFQPKIQNFQFSTVFFFFLHYDLTWIFILGVLHILGVKIHLKKHHFCPTLGLRIKCSKVAELFHQCMEGALNLMKFFRCFCARKWLKWLFYSV